MNKRLKLFSLVLVIIILLLWCTSVLPYVSANELQTELNEITGVRLYDVQGSEYTSSNKAAADDSFKIELDWRIAEDYSGSGSLTFTLPDGICADVGSGILDGGSGTYYVNNSNVSFEFDSGASGGQNGTVIITAVFSENVLFLLSGDELTLTFNDSEGTTLTISFDVGATVNFDDQPASVGDVQAVIDAYYGAVDASASDEDAAAISRARWRYQVSDDLMPPGFICEYVSDDTGFGAPYYSFAVEVSLMSGGNWNGNGSVSSPFVIEDAADLIQLAQNVNNNVSSYDGVSFILAKDIDLSGNSWPGIGGVSTSRQFAGDFYGNGCTIFGLYGSNTSKTGYGLFGYLTGTVENLTVELGSGGLVSTRYYTGVIAGYADGATITNCNVEGYNYLLQSDTEGGGIVGHAAKDVIISGCNVKNIRITTRYEAAGIAGRMGNGSGNNFVTGCTVDNITAISTGGGYAAGLIGIVEGNVSNSNSSYISDCTVTNVSATTSGNYAAGLIGALNMENGSGTTHNYVENCHVTKVTISAYSYSGGLFGCMRYGDVKNCSVTSGNVTARSSYAGGTSGVIYDGSTVDSCAVNDLAVEAIYYAGGFAADIYTDSSGYPSTIKNSYVSGGTVTSTSSYPAGGFTARLRSTSQISFCYAQSDVFNTSTTAVTTAFSGNGGFVGTMYDQSKIMDCYATGSVTTKGNQYSGAFAGQKCASTSTISNCYGTGTVSGGARAAGFAGYNLGASSIVNSFYDTTMTRKTSAVSYGQQSGIVALSTTDAIDFSTYDTGGILDSWGVNENTRGAAEKADDEESSWYIDDDITYPYLYYQYDNHTKDDVNYNMSALSYADDTFVAQKRSDFKILKDSLDLQAKSAGAVKAYFPYSGISLYDISTSSYMPIQGASYSAGGDTLWSLGSVSRTGIIAFSNVPEAVKSSSRSEWNVADESTYTFVGDTVTYQIVINNFSAEADFVDMVFQDYLPSGVTFIEDSVNLTTGNKLSISDTSVSRGDSSNKPSYSYDSNTHILTVYLGDLPKVSETDGTSYYIVTFDVYVEKGAASSFSDQVTYEGNIRNTGFVTGKLRYSDEDVSGEIKVPFDDENEDPVYDAFLFEFYKTDEAGSGLAGAEFKLYYWNGIENPEPSSGKELVTELGIVKDKDQEGWILYDTLSSDLDGLVSEFRLKYYPGCYQLVETAAPPGYKLPASQWLITVSRDAASITIATKTEAGDSQGPDITTVTDENQNFSYYKLLNEKNRGSITIEKYGDNKKPLAGASFAIARWDESSRAWLDIGYDADSGTWYDIADSSAYSQETALDNDGRKAVTVFSDLPLGSYKIYEVLAPDGYSQLLEEFEATIPTSNEAGTSVYDITYQVYNSRVLEMPETGRGLSREQVTIIGLAITAIGGLLFLYKRNTKQNKYIQEHK